MGSWLGAVQSARSAAARSRAVFVAWTGTGWAVSGSTDAYVSAAVVAGALAQRISALLLERHGIYVRAINAPSVRTGPHRVAACDIGTLCDLGKIDVARPVAVHAGHDEGVPVGARPVGAGAPPRSGD
ncbi:aminotransferase class I/II-fold pyridoxal phosphate-dependent enzyme [Kitasatospora sp. NPDC127067]|uniref:aminotransferase class I/II-fold pyridoxal phosphate-dependent enzyme n=1 Tax=Kitasatospora sp. NPDC127067 TaxID=3347126 RepID=UPI00365E9D39